MDKQIKGYIVVKINKKMDIYEADLEFVHGQKWNANFYYRFKFDDELSMWKKGIAAVELGRTAFTNKEDALNAINKIICEKFDKVNYKLKVLNC